MGFSVISLVVTCHFQRRGSLRDFKVAIHIGHTVVALAGCSCRNHIVVSGILTGFTAYRIVNRIAIQIAVHSRGKFSRICFAVNLASINACHRHGLLRYG